MAGTSTTDIKAEKRGLRDNCPKKPDRAAALYRPPLLRFTMRVIVSTNYRNP